MGQFFFGVQAGVGGTAQLHDKVTGDRQYRYEHEELEGLLGVFVEKIDHDYQGCNADQQMGLKKNRDMSGDPIELHT